MGGNGSLVVLAGEPGIGKTAACDQLVRFVKSQGGQALVGHSYEEGSFNLPYQPFVEVFGTYASDRDTDVLRRELGSSASDIARMVPAIQDLLHTEALATGDPQGDRLRLLLAVLAFVRRIAATHPLLLVLEDLHDADRGTLDLLVYLARNLADTPLLIVGTYRDVQVDRAHPLSDALAELRRVSHFIRMDLNGLPVDDVHRLLAATSQHSVPRSLADLVHRRTDGNPLFAHEMLRFLLAEGLFERPDDASGESGRAVGRMAGHIPEGLRDVVGKRLSRLSAAANHALSVASVIGREFQLDVLHRVHAIPDEDLEAALDEAAAAAIVEERAVVGAAVTYRFTHAFFRQTLYEEMLAPRRIRSHQLIARALEDVYSRRLDEHASELAEHYAFSSDAADLAKAVKYGELAAKRARDVFAYGESARQLQRAVHIQDLVNPDDLAKRCDLMLALGDALALAGEMDRAITYASTEALALAEALDDRHRAFQACRIALESFESQGTSSAAGSLEFLRWAERADQYAEPGTVERAHANLSLALAWNMQRRLKEVRALRLDALAIARRASDPETLFLAASYLISSLGSTAPQYQADRVRLAQEAVGWSREGVGGRALGRVLWYAGRLALAGGDRARAVELWREVEDLARRTHVVTVTLSVLERDTLLAIIDGRLDEASTLLDRFITRADELGAPLRAREFSWDMRLTLAEYLGRPEDGLSAIEDYVARASTAARNNPFWVAVRAMSLALLGRASEARTLAGPVLDQEVGRIGEDMRDTIPLVILLKCAIAVEHREAARALADRLACIAHLSLGDWVLTTVARQLGAAAALNGDRAAALAYCAQALEAGGKIGFRPDIALTHLQVAELLLDEGEHSAALEHLDFAIPELRQMKMRSALERAIDRVRLAKQLSPTQRAGVNASDRLTRREREVARLVAEGRSNREIAEALVISEGTVEVHVKHILSKLGFRSRSQVATWILEHDRTVDANALQTPKPLT